MTPESQRLPALDGLRGLAALWVLIAHGMIWGGWYWWRWPSAKIAVDVFMVLSGFLMMHQWPDRVAVGGRSVLHFYWRRFFRIAPLYYSVLIAVWILQTPFLNGYATLRDANPDYWAGDTVYNPRGVTFDTANLLMHISFLFGLVPQYSFSTFLPDWSISLEMQFYVAFPLLLVVFRKLGPAAAAILSAVICLVINHFLPAYPEPSCLPLKLNVFLCGMLAATAVRSFATQPRSALVAAATAFLIAPLDSRILLALLGFLMIYGVSTPGNRFRSIGDMLLGNRLARFLADTSYAVYLLHGLFISLLGGSLFQESWFLASSPRNRVLILMALTVIGTYATAIVLHWTIERPGIRFGRRWKVARPEPPAD